MKLLSWRTSRLPAIVGCCFVVLMVLAASPAQATTIRWTLTGVTLDDGATAFGSFDYDASSASLSNLDISTTQGSFILITPLGSVSFGHHWLDPNGTFPPYPAIGFGIVDLPAPADLTGIRFLGIGFTSPLTNAGGTLGIIHTSGEGFCVDALCAGGQYQRMVTAGSVVGTAIPEPSTLLLLGLGLGTALRRRRT